MIIKDGKRIDGLGDSMPIGSIVEIAGTDIPDGWEEVIEPEDATVYIGLNEPTDGQDIWIKKGKNLFNGKLELGTLRDDGTLKDSGAAVRNVNDISVLDNTTYTMYNDHDYEMIIYFYDRDRQLLGIVRGYGPYTFTTLENTRYLKFRTSTSSTQNDLSTLFQLEAGEEFTGYEEYIDKKIYLKNSVGKYDLFVKNRVYVGPYQPEDGEEIWIRKGKNLIRSFRHDCMYHNGNSAYENSIYGFTATEPIDIELNVPYYFSHQLGVRNGNVNVIDANGVCLEQINPDDMFSPIIITNPNAKKIIINTWDINNQTSVNETWMQLEQGTGVTAYEPYIEKAVYIKNEHGVYEGFKKDNDWEYARPNDEHTLFTVYTSWDDLKEICIRTLGVESATFGYLTVPKEQWHNQGAYGLQVRCIDGNGYFQGYGNFTVTEKGANYFKIAKSGTSTSTQILYKRK